MKLTENVSVNYDVNVNVKTSNLNRSVEKSSRSWSRMRDAMLSTLFTGMQLDRIFGKVVDRNLEMMGGTDMLSSALDIILLPKVSKLNEKFLTFASKLLSSSDATKDFVGNLFVGGWVFGKILSPLTNVVLLIGSLSYLLRGIKLADFIIGFGEWVVPLVILATTLYAVVRFLKFITTNKDKINDFVNKTSDALDKWAKGFQEINLQIKNSAPLYSVPPEYESRIPGVRSSPFLEDVVKLMDESGRLSTPEERGEWLKVVRNFWQGNTTTYNAPKNVTIYNKDEGFLSTPYSYDNW